jgi:hypothetical protein
MHFLILSVCLLCFPLSVRWWVVNATQGDGSHEDSIHFVTVSNRIFAGPLSNLSLSITAVYITILFTIGQFVRLAFGNQVTRIPEDDLPNANKLVQIVEGIYIARQKRQLVKESLLYRRLIKIYRTPALLLMLTTREDTPEEIARARGEQDETNTKRDEEKHGRNKNSDANKGNSSHPHSEGEDDDEGEEPQLRKRPTVARMPTTSSK